MKHLVLIILCLWVIQHASGQSENKSFTLREEWRVMEKDRYVKYSGQKRNAVHFTLTKSEGGSTLVIFDRSEFSVFINGKLMTRSRDTVRWKTDSLLSRHQGNIFISVYQNQPVYSLQTLLERPVQSSMFENSTRQADFFRDFVILASFILIALLAVLFRINPRLTFDYLNVVKLFSVQERDDAIVAGRIGSSVNLFFFGFISFLFSLILIIIFYLAPDRIPLAGNFIFYSTLQSFLVWLVLSVLVFILLVTKLMLITTFALLFSLRSAVRFQFFSFIRLLFVTSMLMGGLALLYFIFRSYSSALYYNLLVLCSVFVLVGTLFLFLKLLTRTAFPIFHLFSYLCATEIIPLMILGKVVLF
jgi:hypothetical protein